MLLATHAILQDYGQRWVAQIKQNIIENHATGNYQPRAKREEMAASIRFEIDEEGLTIYGGQWVFTYEYGRGKTYNMGDGAVRRNALAYIQEQGIQSRGLQRDGSPIDQETLAFFVSRKIHQEGTLLYRTQSQSGILSDVINTDNVQELEDKLFFEIGTQISSRLLEAIE